MLVYSLSQETWDQVYPLHEHRPIQNYSQINRGCVWCNCHEQMSPGSSQLSCSTRHFVFVKTDLWFPVVKKISPLSPVGVNSHFEMEKQTEIMYFIHFSLCPQSNRLFVGCIYVPMIYLCSNSTCAMTHQLFFLKYTVRLKSAGVIWLQASVLTYFYTQHCDKSQGRKRLTKSPNVAAIPLTHSFPIFRWLSCWQEGCSTVPT